MKFDDVMDELGAFGPYQKWLYFLVCLAGIPGALQTLNGVFMLGIPDHRCALPDLDNDTYDSQGPWHDTLVNLSVPWDGDEERYSQCYLYRRAEGSNLYSRNSSGSCDRWVYSQDPFKTTFVSEIDMVCDDKSLRTYANMILMGGQLGGSLVLGSLSDVIGRKKVMLIGIVGQFAVAMATAFVTSFWPFVILRFFTTFFGIGYFLAAYVIGIELIGPEYRKFAGIVIEMFWCVGLYILTGLAYGIRDWKYLQIACSGPIILLVVYIWLLPESARWLLNKDRVKEASSVIRRVAVGNGVVLSEKVASLSEVELEGKGEKIWHMFTSPSLLVRSLVIFFNWTVASMVYYGLSLNVGALSGDIYLNFFISGLVELASYIFCLLLLDVTGRRPLQCASMLLGGVACIATMIPVIYGDEDVEWVTITLSMVGKFGASAAFAVIYVYSAELFPTVMRNSGMGLSSLSARIGGIMAPYIADIGDVIDGDLGVALPLVIYGGVCVVAGLLALLLPETAHQTLPDTVEDARNFGKKNYKKSPPPYALDVISNSAPNKEGAINPIFTSD